MGVLLDLRLYGYKFWMSSRTSIGTNKLGLRLLLLCRETALSAGFSHGNITLVRAVFLVAVYVCGKIMVLFIVGRRYCVDSLANL